MKTVVLSFITIFVSSCSSNNMSHMQKGMIAFESHNSNEAVKQLSLAYKENPTNEAALFYRGLSYYELGDLDKASSDYSEVIVFSKKLLISSLINKASIFVDKSQFKDAISNYKLALAIESDNPKINSSLARVYFKSNNFDLACEFYEKSISLESKSEVILTNYALALLKSKEYYDTNKSIKYSQQAIEIEKNTYNLSINAQAQAEKGNYTQAIAQQLEAIEVAKKRKQTKLVTRGEFYLNKYRKELYNKDKAQ